ncbi:MAG: DUF2490 domain-containing protein [Chloroherpetonaceae bacterium]|nr:DUF2490 domain-containing protein [Chloroherpetonaceae bacterium]
MQPEPAHKMIAATPLLVFFFYCFFLCAFALPFALSPNKFFPIKHSPPRQFGIKSRAIGRSKSVIRAVWLGYLLVMQSAVEPILAQPFTHDAASWSSGLAIVRFKETPLSFNGFVQVRFIQNSTQFQTTVFSGLLNYRISPDFSAGLGYTALTPINNRILEIAFLQGLWEVKLGQVAIPIRARAEWRWYVGVNNFDDLPPGSWRFRLRADAVVPISESLSGVVNNEYFFIPETQFFNQNRFQIGPRIIFSPSVSLDVLYQNRIIGSIPNAANRMEHTFLTMLIFKLDFNYFERESNSSTTTKTN